MLEASASVALWLQWLILLVLQMTRAATSSGADLDSWMADFSLTRLPASPATGTVTFSRYNANATALVPMGTLVRTIDGSETFAVTSDPSVAGWNQQLNGYVLGIGTTSLNAPVVAQAPGSGGNVLANTVTVLAAALAGVDSVTNAAGFANGVDAETDAAFRLRFQNFLASRSRATLASIEYAIGSVQQGLSYAIQENQDPTGQFQLGSFIVVVDDGSGYPSNGLLSAVQQAINAVRPVGSTFAVFPPVVTQVDVSLSVITSDGSDVTTVTPQIVTAIQSYVNALPVGASLPASRIVQIAYGAVSNIANVTDVLLNSEASDVTIAPSGVAMAGVVVVS
ncbi:MAG TPA: baseplate J/gp47 family protein [Acetobacteraceae bacterium]|nr:baseplate J/gp47 family protein [Acetobacteraceae bacterium]